MFFKYKNKVFITIGVIFALVFSVFLKTKNDHRKQEQKQIVDIEQLKTEAQKNKSKFLDYSLKRSELQIKILKETKSMTSALEKLIIETRQVQFLQQEDFNNYEQKQNEIQNVITKKIIDGLKSKDTKWQQYFQKNIKQLELVERDLNQARMKFSENIYEISQKENKKAVTFLSDTAIIENLKSKKN